MRTLVLILVALLMSAALLAATQELLPATLGDWAATRKVTIGPREIERLAGEDAAILKEYGVTGAEQRTYSRGGQSVEVTVFLFPDSSTSYGAFSFLRSDAIPLGEHSGAGGQRRGLERVLLGNFILETSGNGLETQRSALRELQKQLLVWSDGAPYPLLVQYLPTEGLIAGSERYLLSAPSLARALPTEQGDWASFRYGAEAQLARYRTNGKETTLLLISYPTPQAAQLKQAELGRWFNVNNSETAPTNRPAVHVRRILSVLAIALDSNSSETAKALLDNVHYQPNFSWNEPSHHATDPPILFMIYRIIVEIGALLAFTLVAGVSFGGLRIVTKLFFPGKIFDRAESMEILQLGLNSKPIEAKDFY